MKANELMIGDWVFFDGNPVKVAILGAAESCLGLRAGENVFGQPFVMIDPIELTPEILEKNFRRDTTWTGAYYLNDHVHIYYDKDDDLWTIQYMEIADLRYVHELQHALRLCGFEKEIVP